MIILPSMLTINSRRSTSNHHELYTASREAATPKSFSIKVAKAIEKARVNTRKPIKGMENRNLYIFDIVTVFDSTLL